MKLLVNRAAYVKNSCFCAESGRNGLCAESGKNGLCAESGKNGLCAESGASRIRLTKKAMVPRS